MLYKCTLFHSQHDRARALFRENSKFNTHSFMILLAENRFKFDYMLYRIRSLGIFIITIAIRSYQF